MPYRPIKKSRIRSYGLDIYPSDSLNSPFGGGAVEQPFSPLDIPGILLWQKADQLSLNDNDGVTTWDTSIPLGVSPTQPLVGKRPIFKTNILNGKPAVRFDGVDDFLTFGAIDFNQGPHSIFAVIILRGAPSNYDTIFISKDLLANGLRLHSKLSTAQWGTFVTPTDRPANTTLLVDTSYLLEMIYDGANGAFFIEGVADGIWAGNPAGNAAVSDIGGDSSAPGRESQIDILELIAYDSNLSGGNLSLLRTYLIEKYAL